MERPNAKLVKKDWKLIDDHVNKITDHDERSYTHLIAFFDKKIKTRLDRNIFMTRAIIYWLYVNGDRKEWSDRYSEDSPLKLMKAVVDKQTSTQDAFKRLCDKAGIPCECVNGIAKLARFEPGQKDMDGFRARWNKVMLEGSWWPVYPDWILTSVTSDKRSDVRQLTDFWFLTDPEIFIYKCYPDKVEDQMLPPSKQVKDVRKFSKLPLLSYHFFNQKLKLTSEASSVIDADDGKCIISFKCDNSARAKTLKFYPRLTLPSPDKTGGKTYTPDRLVFNSRRKGQFIFEIRCPMLGFYNLEIRGGPMDGVEDNSKKYLTAKIECLETSDAVCELPVATGNKGWGFGPAAENAGLSKPTVKDPKVVVTLKKKQVFGFTLDKHKAKSAMFEAKLHAGDNRDHQDKGSVGTRLTSSGLEVTVTVQRAGEFALTIYVTEGKSKATPICHYLVSTLENAEAVAEEFEDSDDGLSDLDEENFKLEREVTELEEKYNALVRKAELSALHKR